MSHSQDVSKETNAAPTYKTGKGTKTTLAGYRCDVNYGITYGEQSLSLRRRFSSHRNGGDGVVVVFVAAWWNGRHERLKIAFLWSAGSSPAAATKEGQQLKQV